MRGDLVRKSGNLKTTSEWPTTIKCEMNIAVWKNALAKAGLSEKYADVIEAKWAEEEIRSNFQKEVDAGRMRSRELRRINPADQRFVIPTQLTQNPISKLFVTKQDFSTTWDDFKTVAAFFRQNSTQYELGLFDWEKAYRQIPTKMDQWPFLLVQDFDGNLLLDTRITFGGVAGCGSFGRPQTRGRSYDEGI
ncbi:hypothetical protein PSTT_10453 [Puccinia striiformis]|uniref:Reverse transcriptase domain-containing protein n=1 Tax=Puccinia striiformis TaxID=27350 RepID=A0A2S4V4D1_9BASI|nr:hypothetical protein PSTT_10453 [Puccinia striiformis]